MNLILRLPLLILLSVLSGLAMLVPAIYASVINQDAIARNFLYAALLVLIVTGMIALATSANRRRPRSRDTLLSMLAVMGLMPLILAIPLAEIYDWMDREGYAALTPGNALPVVASASTP